MVYVTKFVRDISFETLSSFQVLNSLISSASPVLIPISSLAFYGAAALSWKRLKALRVSSYWSALLLLVQLLFFGMISACIAFVVYVFISQGSNGISIDYLIAPQTIIYYMLFVGGLGFFVNIFLICCPSREACHETYKKGTWDLYGYAIFLGKLMLVMPILLLLVFAVSYFMKENFLLWFSSPFMHILWGSIQLVLFILYGYGTVKRLRFLGYGIVHFLCALAFVLLLYMFIISCFIFAAESKLALIMLSFIPFFISLVGVIQLVPFFVNKKSS